MSRLARFEAGHHPKESIKVYTVYVYNFMYCNLSHYQSIAKFIEMLLLFLFCFFFVVVFVLLLFYSFTFFPSVLSARTYFAG